MKLQELLSPELQRRFEACYAARGKVDTLERYQLTSDLLEEIGKLKFGASVALLAVGEDDEVTRPVLLATVERLDSAAAAGVQTWAGDRHRLRQEGRLPA